MLKGNSLSPLGAKKKDVGAALQMLIRTLRSEDSDGRENVAEKVNSLSSNLHCDYSKSLTLSNVGGPS